MATVHFPLLTGSKDHPSTLKQPNEWLTTFAEWDVEPLTFSPVSLLKAITVLVVKIIGTLTLIGLVINYFSYADLKERVAVYQKYERSVQQRQELHKLVTVDGKVPHFKEIECRDGTVGLAAQFRNPGEENLWSTIQFTQKQPETSAKNSCSWEMERKVTHVKSAKEKLVLVDETVDVSFSEVKERVAQFQAMAQRYLFVKS